MHCLFPCMLHVRKCVCMCMHIGCLLYVCYMFAYVFICMLHICVLYVYIHVCWCECSYVLYVCVYIHIFMSRHMSVQVSLPLWVRKDLSLKLQLVILHKLASKPLVFPHLLTLSTGATYVLPHLDFRQALGTEFTFSCLLSKYFDHWANSPPLLCVSHIPPIKHGPTSNSHV